MKATAQPLIRSRSIVFLILATALAGCSTVRTKDNPSFDKAAYDRDPPRSLAIAPAKNHTKFEDFDVRTRTAVYGAFAPLEYNDVEMARVDKFVAAKAASLNLPAGQVPPDLLLDPALADAVLYTELDKVSRLYLIFYSSIKVQMRVAMLRAATGEILYENEISGTNRYVTAPFDPFGVFSALFTSLWHIRGEQITDAIHKTSVSLSESYQKSIRELPPTSIKTPRIEVKVPGPVLKAGDRIMVKVYSGPGLEVTYSISNLAPGAPLPETAPGEYAAFYTVREGQNSRHSHVELTLTDPREPAKRYTTSADNQAFSVDTTPPSLCQISDWNRNPVGEGIILRIAQVAGGSGDASEIPTLYHIYRGTDPTGELKLIGTTGEPVFDDPAVRPGSVYVYSVVTEDAVGNLGKAGPRSVVSPQVGIKPAAVAR